MHYAWRYFTDVPTASSPSSWPAIVADLRRLDGTFSSANGRVVEGTLLQSGLLPLLVSVQERWASVAAVLAVVGLGPGRRSGSRRSRSSASSSCSAAAPSLALGRARGASSGQLILEVLIEGLVISAAAGRPRHGPRVPAPAQRPGPADRHRGRRRGGPDRR